MKALNVTWEQHVGDLRLHESEHMFGFDLVMSRCVDERWYPVAIISRQSQMNGLEQTWASRWLAAVAGEDYGLAVHYMMCITEAETDQ